MAVSKERATEVIEYANVHGDEKACSHFLLPQETINRYRRIYNSISKENIQDIPEEELVKLSASKQRFQDINSVLRKENRETYRLYNSLEEIYSEYVKVLKSSPFKISFLPKHEEFSHKKHAIIHLSDLHLNELIDAREANGNYYDFQIASKRLKKFIDTAIKYMKANESTDVCVVCTGDIINSNRRLSEKLAQATSQVRASLLATYLIQQVIVHLSQFFNVSFAGVVGNESRIGDVDFDSSDILASENWDYMIYQQLRMLFEGTDIEFFENINQTQTVITLDNGFNGLLVHGNYLKNIMSDKQIGTLLQSYTYRGIPIHGVFCGHIHSASVGDTVSRCSSLCGGNAYSTNDLMFISRASQNIYLVNDDLSYDGIKIDVQSAEGYEGYDIISELERYNIKSGFATSEVVIRNLV